MFVAVQENLAQTRKLSQLALRSIEPCTIKFERQREEPRAPVCQFTPQMLAKSHSWGTKNQEQHGPPAQLAETQLLEPQHCLPHYQEYGIRRWALHSTVRYGHPNQLFNCQVDTTHPPLSSTYIFMENNNQSVDESSLLHGALTSTFLMMSKLIFILNERT